MPSGAVTAPEISTLAVSAQVLPLVIASTHQDGVAAERTQRPQASEYQDSSLSRMAERSVSESAALAPHGPANGFAPRRRPPEGSALASALPPPLLDTTPGGLAVAGGAGSGSGSSAPAAALFALLGGIVPRVIRRLYGDRLEATPGPVLPLLDRPG
jgi:hypothetical protein